MARGDHIGIACQHKGCATQAFSGPRAFDEWLAHSEATGHKDHRWTNVYNEDQLKDFNRPYSHPSGRF